MLQNKVKLSNKTVAVIGLGYVGLPLALLASKKGYSVIGIDTNQTKISMIIQKQAPFNDASTIKNIALYDINATTDSSEIVNAEIVIICVPTPVDENKLPNYEPIKNVCYSIGKSIKEGQLIIIESTINPLTTESIIIPILESESGMIAGKDFYVSYAPERINPGDAKWNVENIPRVVGSLEAVGLKKTVLFYSSILSAEITPMENIREAEAVKIIENCFRDVNIAFVNELAQSFDHLGIDVVNVINGASKKPFSFLSHFPGCGVGGHCIAVDPYYLINQAKKYGFDHKLLSLSRVINDSMPEYTINLLRKSFLEKNLDISTAKIAVLGLAYKKNIDDLRESPSLEIVKILKNNNISHIIYDHFIQERSNRNSLKEVLEYADAIIIATDHDEYTQLNPKILEKYNISIVIDGRNCLDKSLFQESDISYYGIGRKLT